MTCHVRAPVQGTRPGTAPLAPAIAPPRLVRRSSHTATHDPHACCGCTLRVPPDSHSHAAHALVLLQGTRPQVPGTAPLAPGTAPRARVTAPPRQVRRALSMLNTANTEPRCAAAATADAAAATAYAADAARPRDVCHAASGLSVHYLHMHSLLVVHNECAASTPAHAAARTANCTPTCCALQGIAPPLQAHPLPLPTPPPLQPTAPPLPVRPLELQPLLCSLSCPASLVQSALPVSGAPTRGPWPCSTLHPQPCFPRQPCS
jgi:hypothetical protein